MRVLVVSEQAVERLRAASALHLHAQDDAEVVEATSAEDARALLERDADFDVLVIDGDLYPRGGYGLLYGIRAQAELRGQASPPAVILMDREQDRWLADWAGANAVLVKPVPSFALARQVEDLVGAGAAQHGATESSDQVADLLAAGHGQDAGLSP